MKYSHLHTELLKLENCFGLASHSMFPSSLCIRKNGKAKFQGFGLDQSHGTIGDYDVVVAIGANYTQKNQNVPRDAIASLSIVEDNLALCRKHLNAGFAHYKTFPRLWESNGAASHMKLMPNEQYHFVMTNFCIWITENSWLNTQSHLRADMLENNPRFRRFPVQSPTWLHLTELIKILSGTKVIWVAHGLHNEVFTVFRTFIRTANIQDWCLMPNLSYPYSHFGKKFP